MRSRTIAIIAVVILLAAGIAAWRLTRDTAPAADAPGGPVRVPGEIAQ